MTSERKTERKKAHIAENIAAIIGAVLVLGCISILLYNSASHGRTPPELAVSVTEIKPLGGQFLVQFKVTNSGGSAAASVRIAGTLSGAETSEVILDYVPPDSEREGGLLFVTDPASKKLDVRATGFSIP